MRPRKIGRAVGAVAFAVAVASVAPVAADEPERLVIDREWVLDRRELGECTVAAPPVLSGRLQLDVDLTAGTLSGELTGGGTGTSTLPPSCVDHWGDVPELWSGDVAIADGTIEERFAPGAREFDVTFGFTAEAIGERTADGISWRCGTDEFTPTCVLEIWPDQDGRLIGSVADDGTFDLTLELVTFDSVFCATKDTAENRIVWGRGCPTAVSWTGDSPDVVEWQVDAPEPEEDLPVAGADQAAPPRDVVEGPDDGIELDDEDLRAEAEEGTDPTADGATDADEASATDDIPADDTQDDGVTADESSDGGTKTLTAIGLAIAIVLLTMLLFPVFREFIHRIFSGILDRISQVRTKTPPAPTTPAAPKQATYSISPDGPELTFETTVEPVPPPPPPTPPQVFEIVGTKDSGYRYVDAWSEDGQSVTRLNTGDVVEVLDRDGRVALVRPTSGGPPLRVHRNDLQMRNPDRSGAG